MPGDDRAPRQFQQTAVAASQGLLIVYTGDGKGKTTAALGLAFRALGRSYRVAMVEFIKGTWKTGEAMLAKELAGRIDHYAMGDGFTWDTRNLAQDVASAQRAWDKCLDVLVDTRYQVVIFDELNCALAYNFLSLDDVLAGLRRKPRATHVVITGRDAPQALIDTADLVTEMREIKHPYQVGLAAQPGVDY